MSLYRKGLLHTARQLTAYLNLANQSNIFELFLQNQKVVKKRLVLFNRIKGFLHIKRAIKARHTNCMPRFSITYFSPKTNQEMVLPAFKILLEPPDIEMSSAAGEKKTMLCAIWHKNDLFFLPLKTS